MWNENTVIPPTPEHVIKASSFHEAWVTQVHGDPLNRGRVKVSCPSLFHTGKENWSNWCEISNFNIGTYHNNGDTGFHWPPAPGQRVLLGFIEGEYLNPFVIPIHTWNEEPKPKKQMTIKEVKAAADKDKQHLHYYMKTPAGHTLQFCDDTGKEALSLMHASGMGLFQMGGFKGSEPQQGKDAETKYRTADTRGDKSVATQTSPQAGAVFKDGTAVTSLLGQTGSGVNILDSPEAGGVLISAHAYNSAYDGASIWLSSKDGGSVIITAGATQWILSAEDDIKVTRQIILEIDPIDIAKLLIEPLKAKIKGFFSSVFSGGTAQQEQQQNQQDQQNQQNQQEMPGDQVDTSDTSPGDGGNNYGPYGF